MPLDNSYHKARAAMANELFPDPGLGGRHGRLPLFLTIFGSAGLFFGQPNTLAHLPFLTLLFPFCLYLLALEAASDGKAFMRGFWLGMGGNCAGLYWLIYPMHDVAQLPFPAAIVCVALLSVYLACFTGLTALGMRRLHHLLSPEEPIDCTAFRPLSSWRLLLSPLTGGFIYGGFEFLLGTLFTGFPWLSLSSAFAFWPAWVQVAAFTGSYGLSALYAAGACFLAAAVRVQFPERKTHAAVSHIFSGRRRFLAAGLCFCAGMPLLGLFRLNAPLPEAIGSPLTVLMVQGNINQNQKWEPQFQEHSLNRYIRLSETQIRNNATSNPIGLVIWPETAMPFYYQIQHDYAARLKDFALRNKVNLAFGTLGLEHGQGGANSLRNRFYLLSYSGKTIGYYDKRHLVPFGEYIPLTFIFSFLQDLLQGIDFSAGTQSSPLYLSVPLQTRPHLTSVSENTPKNSTARAPAANSSPSEPALSLGVLICYEAIFPYLAQEQTEKGASILINVSNDAWFRQSSAPWQHLSLATMRAIEQARPLVRSTNTGISAVIDARGRIIAHDAALFTENTLVATVSPTNEHTLYHRLYPAPEAFLTLLALFSLIAHKLRGHKHTKETR